MGFNASFTASMYGDFILVSLLKFDKKCFALQFTHFWVYLLERFGIAHLQRVIGNVLLMVNSTDEG
jgi:hypothetical protein